MSHDSEFSLKINLSTSLEIISKQLQMQRMSPWQWQQPSSKVASSIKLPPLWLQILSALLPQSYMCQCIKPPRVNNICCGGNDNTNTLREKAKLPHTQIFIVKTCKDLYSMPVPAYRPMQDSLTALTTELRALSQPQPRNVRISSTLLPGMSKVPFPFFFKRSQSLSPPMFWTCHIPPPSFQRCQAPPSPLSTKSRVSSCAQYSELSDSPH